MVNIYLELNDKVITTMVRKWQPHKTRCIALIASCMTPPFKILDFICLTYKLGHSINTVIVRIAIAMRKHYNQKQPGEEMLNLSGL